MSRSFPHQLFGIILTCCAPATVAGAAITSSSADARVFNNGTAPGTHTETYGTCFQVGVTSASCSASGSYNSALPGMSPFAFGSTNASSSFGSVSATADASVNVGLSVTGSATASFSDTITFLTAGPMVTLEYEIYVRSGHFDRATSSAQISIGGLTLPFPADIRSGTTTTGNLSFPVGTGIPIAASVSANVATSETYPWDFSQGNGMSNAWAEIAIRSLRLFHGVNDAIPSFTYSSASGVAYPFVNGTLVSDVPVSVPEPGTAPIAIFAFVFGAGLILFRNGIRLGQGGPGHWRGEADRPGHRASTRS